MKQTIRIICSLFLVSFWGAGGLCAGEEAGSQLVDKIDTAAINWTEGCLNAVGRGEPPVAPLGDDQGRKTALAAAVSDAREKLMAAILLIPIDTGSTVGDLVKNDEAVFSALKEMVDTAEVVHQEFSTGGSVDVTVQMSMSGGFSQLVLPKVIKQIESIKPIATLSDEPGIDGDGVQPNDVVSGPYTGMIVDVRGILITPCMAPRVTDENGREVFGPAYASREFAVQRGMSVYVSDMEAATKHPRVAGRPLVLKGIRAGGAGGNDIIVSNTDAARLRSAFENLALLRQCRVMIVMDGPETSKDG